MRKGDAELQILALLFFIATIAQWAFMVGAPHQYDEMITRQTNDAEAVVKSGTIRGYMEDEFVPKSLGDAAYQGMYEQGQDGVGPWSPGDIPEWDTVRQEFDTSVTGQVQGNYIGAMGSGAGCSLNGQDQVAMTITGETTGDPPFMTFDVANDGPLHVECESTAPVTDFEAGRSVTATELIAVPESWEVDRMRYESLHSIAYDLTRDDELRSTIADTLTYSSNYIEEIGSEQDAGNCDNNGNGPADPNCEHLTSGTVTFPSFAAVQTDAENTQGEIAASDLQTALDDLADDFAADIQGEYGEIDIEAEVVEVDYTVDEHHQVSDDDTEQDGFRVTSCDQSCRNVDTDSDSCSACGCTASCSCNADPCPSTVCSTSGSWNSYERSGDIWTQDPWTTSDGGSTTVASLYEWDENYYNGPVATPSAAHPGDGSNIRRIGIPSDDEDCTGDTCTCRDVEQASNDVDQTPRRVWEIDQLSSAVTVEIRITDLENEIPVATGFEHPVFTVEYVQEQTWDFTGDPDYQTATG